MRELTMNRDPVSIPALPRSLSSPETWGFGFSGLLLWLGTAPGMNAALGPRRFGFGCREQSLA